MQENGRQKLVVQRRIRTGALSLWSWTDSSSGSSPSPPSLVLSPSSRRRPLCTMTPNPSTSSCLGSTRTSFYPTLISTPSFNTKLDPISSTRIIICSNCLHLITFYSVSNVFVFV